MKLVADNLERQLNASARSNSLIRSRLRHELLTPAWGISLIGTLLDFDDCELRSFRSNFILKSFHLCTDYDFIKSSIREAYCSGRCKNISESTRRCR